MLVDSPRSGFPFPSYSRFSYSLSRESGIFSGLDGAIQRLIVNGNLMENLMDHVKDSQNIGHYVGPPCEQTPCQNGGVCRPFYRSYTCKCSGGFVGQHCEKGKLKHMEKRGLTKKMQRNSLVRSKHFWVERAMFYKRDG